MDVQEEAASRVAESGTHVSQATRALAALGNTGAQAQNIERDLHRLIDRACSLPVVAPSAIWIGSWHGATLRPFHAQHGRTHPFVSI